MLIRIQNEFIGTKVESALSEFHEIDTPAGKISSIIKLILSEMNAANGIVLRSKYGSQSLTPNGKICINRFRFLVDIHEGVINSGMSFGFGGKIGKDHFFKRDDGEKVSSSPKIFSPPKENDRTTNPHRARILSSPEYGELMKDPDILFHGIDTAIWKIPSILKLGILSKAVAEANKITLGFNYGSQSLTRIDNGFNGETYISCARSPVHVDAYGDECGAFGLFIKDGISFAISGVQATGVYLLKEHNSQITGEALASNFILSKNIIGLVASETLLHTRVTEINFLFSRRWC